MWWKYDKTNELGEARDPEGMSDKCMIHSQSGGASTGKDKV
jgi:hypothetical protein